MNDGLLQFLGLTKKAGKLMIGYNKCEEGIKNNSINLMLLSIDSSENTKNKFNWMCSTRSIPVIQKYNKEDLGRAIGFEEIKVIGVQDKRMSEKLLELYKKQFEI